MPATLARRPDGELVVVVGAPGSGKTLYVMRAAARTARLLVWDSHLDWSAHGCTPLATIADLARACASVDPMQLAYTGPVARAEFERFSRVALAWLKLAPGGIVVEELADVSPPGKAPGAWGELIRWSRKLGGTLYAITQRPQESDKTVFGNAHRIICHAPGEEGDCLYMARRLGVDVARISALDRTRCEYLERLPDRTLRLGRTPKPREKI